MPDEYNRALALAADIMRDVRAPFVRAYVSTLGGKNRAAVLITISLDPKETWTNAILENSRHLRLSAGADGVLESFSGHGTAKFRKTRWKNREDVVAKLQKWVDANP